MLNDYTSINLTKLDVLSHLDTIKVGMHYEVDGERINGMPDNLDELSKVEVHYEELPGWNENIE
jgi:adenylosuccinate synthase